MKNFHSDAERIPSFRHCMIHEQTIDKFNVATALGQNDTYINQRFLCKCTCTENIFLADACGHIELSKKNLEKTWKIIRFPGTGLGWILYSGKLGLGSAQFFSRTVTTNCPL